ncbi:MULTISPECIES: hypothetical protein [unclassified Moorena]|uniref:hypothetical protein n=1 Tax=unclassified Moorena TaxID=2683338 RepID=UPI0013CAD0BB|nr:MULTISPECIES: hypothetical protein [unclassified Moorena]NEO20964.1 hypothetical protein [Moorena sp. SIO4A5]NEQ60022.1 hypothetical protein [Moorena sp. SIO4A1]
MNISHFRQKVSKKKQFVYLFIIPVIFAVISLIIRQEFGPYWLGINSDPEYAYLLNFLNIIQFQTPGHTDHPGTTLQVFGAIVIQITYFIQYLTNSVVSNITESVLQNPEFYLITVNTILLLIITSCLLLVGLVAFAFSQNIALSLLLQLGPFLWTPLQESTRVRPETLLLSLTQVLVILLLFYLYSERARLPKFALAIGIVLGLGISTKVTFIPMILVIMLLPGWFQKGLAIFTTIVTFFITTSPIFSQYPRLFNWLTSIATHTGHYGSGNPGLVDISNLPSTFINLIPQDRFFFYTVGLSVLNFFIVTVWFWLARPTLQNFDLQHKYSPIVPVQKLYLLYLCLLLIIGFQIMLTLKHPATHYLIPSMGLCSLLIWVQVTLFEQQLTTLLQPSIYAKLSLLVLTVYVTASAAVTYQLMLQDKNSHQSYRGEIKTINQLIKQNYNNCIHVRYYRSSDRQYALKFGNDFASNRFSKVLEYSFPDGFFYNIWSRKYESFNQELDLSNLIEKNCIIFQGSPLNEAHYSQFMPSTTIEIIFEGQSESLYKLIQKPNDEIK